MLYKRTILMHVRTNDLNDHKNNLCNQKQIKTEFMKNDNAMNTSTQKNKYQVKDT